MGRKKKEEMIKFTLRIPFDLAADISLVADHLEESKAVTIRTILYDYCKQFKAGRIDE